MGLWVAVLTVSAEQSAGTACGCCRRGYWAVVEALIPKGSIAVVQTCSSLTPAPSSAASELPRQYDDAKTYGANRAVLLRKGEVDNISGGVLYFASDLSKYTIGQTLAIDGEKQFI